MKLQYEGGPRDGQLFEGSQLLQRPVIVSCWSDIKIGSEVGLYREVGTVLKWVPVNPPRQKCHEDPRTSNLINSQGGL